MRVTAILNLKGGVAKTATTVNMAAILAADYGQRVLVVDADSQANATEFLGGDPQKAGMSDMLRGKISDINPVELQRTSIEGVELVAADDSLMDLDLTKVESGGAQIKCLLALRQLLEQRCAGLPAPYNVILGEPVDYMLIDCPPAFNAASAAALVAADDVIIPIKLDAFSLRGMANLMRQIKNMQQINPQLRLAGLLPTMVYKSENMAEARKALAESKLPAFPAIRRTNKVDDMTFAQEPLVKCSPKSAACVDYRRFVKNYMRGEIPQPLRRQPPLGKGAKEIGEEAAVNG